MTRYWIPDLIRKVKVIIALQDFGHLALDPSSMTRVFAHDDCFCLSNAFFQRLLTKPLKRRLLVRGNREPRHLEGDVAKFVFQHRLGRPAPDSNREDEEGHREDAEETVQYPDVFSDHVCFVHFFFCERVVVQCQTTPPSRFCTTSC